jgi:hypothetical protein
MMVNTSIQWSCPDSGMQNLAVLVLFCAMKFWSFDPLQIHWQAMNRGRRYRCRQVQHHFSFLILFQT